MGRHSGEGGAVEDVRAHGFGTAPAEEHADEVVESLAEFWAEFGRGHRVERAERLLVVDGADEGKALALGEEAADGVADGVLRLDRGSAAWDVAEGALEVLRGGDGGGVVLEVKVKVAKEPDEGGGKTSELGGISRRAAPSLAPGLDADVLGHLCHQGEAIERRLVDAAHLVVHEE